MKGKNKIGLSFFFGGLVHFFYFSKFEIYFVFFFTFLNIECPDLNH